MNQILVEGNAFADIFDTDIGNLYISEITLGVWVTVSDSIEPTIPDEENGGTNIDIDDDGIPDMNIDTDEDGEAEINVDIDSDYIPDINLDKDGDKVPDVNIDIDGDGVADFNFDENNDGVADTNILRFTIVDGIIIFDDNATDLVLSTITPENPKIKIDNFGPGLRGIELSTYVLADYAEKGNELILDYGRLQVYADNQSLKDISDAATYDSVVIIAERMVKSSFNILQEEAFGENSVGFGVEFSVKSDNKLLNENITGKMEMTAKFTFHEETLPEDYKFYSVSYTGDLEEEDYVYEDGKLGRAEH